MLHSHHCHLRWQGVHGSISLPTLAGQCLVNSWCCIPQYNYCADLTACAWPGTYPVATSTVTRTSSFTTWEAVKQQWNLHLSWKKK